MSTTKNPHFDKKFIEAQRTLLLGIKEQILNNLSEKSKEDLHIDSDEVIEEGDQAQTYLNQNLSFGLRERDLFKLREIEAALIRIDDGTYGLCEELEESQFQRSVFKKYLGRDLVLKLLSNLKEISNSTKRSVNLLG